MTKICRLGACGGSSAMTPYRPKHAVQAEALPASGYEPETAVAAVAEWEAEHGDPQLTYLPQLIASRSTDPSGRLIAAVVS